MHCMACGAEMILVKTIEDVSMPIAGFERRAYMCSLCHETEQRLVFNKRPEEREPEPTSTPASVVPTSMARNLVQTAKSLVRLVRAQNSFDCVEQPCRVLNKAAHYVDKLTSRSVTSGL